jgi:hypothetical protein
MSGFRSRTPDEDGVSATAALAALGGHAMIILAVMLLGGRTQTVAVTSGVVGVTLVSDAPGEASTASTAAPAAASATPKAAPRTSSLDLAGERLDHLLSPDAAESPSASPPLSPPLGQGGHPAPSNLSGAKGAAGQTGTSGSSQASQGLGQGEGAEGIDLYAAASLPDVGPRPASPPAGDLWKKVAPCWRSASPRKATLMVEIGDDGRLTVSPKAVRKISAPADPQLLLAERAAARALQACAPYEGLGGRTWRVSFP